MASEGGFQTQVRRFNANEEEQFLQPQPQPGARTRLNPTNMIPLLGWWAFAVLMELRSTLCVFPLLPVVAFRPLFPLIAPNRDCGTHSPSYHKGTRVLSSPWGRWHERTEHAVCAWAPTRRRRDFEREYSEHDHKLGEYEPPREGHSGGITVEQVSQRRYWLHVVYNECFDRRPTRRRPGRSGSSRALNISSEVGCYKTLGAIHPDDTQSSPPHPPQRGTVVTTLSYHQSNLHAMQLRRTPQMTRPGYDRVTYLWRTPPRVPRGEPLRIPRRQSPSPKAPPRPIQHSAGRLLLRLLL